MLLPGRVIRAQSRSFDVETDEGRIKVVALKGLRSRFPDLVDPVAVGDRVKVRRGAGTEGTLVEVLPRSNRLSRPAVWQDGREQLIAANLSRAVIVQAVEPRWKTATWDRYLVMTSAGGVPPALCLNKIDLDPGMADAPELDAYRDLGIPVVVTSARTGEGLDRLRDLLRGAPAVLIGPSGGGKSTLINAMAPGAGLPTGALARSTGKGRHTTTWVQLVPLEGGIEVVDSPGLRVLGLWGVTSSNLASHFPEMASLEGRCRFSPCSHVHEPDCVVRLAVDNGKIRDFRYRSYTRLHAELTKADTRAGKMSRRR